MSLGTKSLQRNEARVAMHVARLAGLRFQKTQSCISIPWYCPNPNSVQGTKAFTLTSGENTTEIALRAVMST